jgi:hypothetical protein
MDEKHNRKNKRYAMHVESIIISDIKYNTTKQTEYVADIVDISESGLGFRSYSNLKTNHIYKAKISLFNKHMIEPYIDIKWKCKNKDYSYSYGGEFIGLSEYEKANLHAFFVIIDRKY